MLMNRFPGGGTRVGGLRGELEGIVLPPGCVRRAGGGRTSAAGTHKPAATVCRLRVVVDALQAARRTKDHTFIS